VEVASEASAVRNSARSGDRLDGGEDTAH
jgi:hypothetical protein